MLYGTSGVEKVAFYITTNSVYMRDCRKAVQLSSIKSESDAMNCCGSLIIFFLTQSAEWLDSTVFSDFF